MAQAVETPQATKGADRRPAGSTDPARPIRIALVDDHPVLRHSLGLLLRGHGIEIVANAGSAAEARELVAREQPDVVVLDLALPDESGAELCERLLEGRPEQGVLIYTGVGDEDVLSRALDCGARGYLLTSASTDELVEAIRAVARGESYLDPRLGSLLLGRHATRRGGVLSPRERETLGLLAGGLTMEGIASRLHLAPETVRTHLRNAMKKLSASTRTHAVAIALRKGEIDL